MNLFNDIEHTFIHVILFSERCGNYCFCSSKQFNSIDELKADYDEDEKEITGEFTDDEHSDPVKGKDGVRQVKEKYLPDFNKSRLELLSIKRELEFVPLPCSAIDDMEILDKDYRILDLFLED